jgi:hypothetical protein
MIGVFLLVLSGCSKGSDSSGTESKPAAPEETKKEAKDIVIGVLADLTGATADVGRPYNEGMLGAPATRRRCAARSRTTSFRSCRRRTPRC